MQTLLVIGLVGFVAQLIDGALGMAYGVSSTTLLLTAGIAPAAASASVHFAEIGTTLASAVSHSRFRNVDWRVVRLVALPGALGAFAGAVVLSSISAEMAKPWMAAFLFVLGAVVLVRFTLGSVRREASGRPLRAVFLRPLGLFAGFMDAAGGGGWGPIGTPALMSTGRMEPRKVVGSIDTSEFLVAVGASAGFLLSFPALGVNMAWVGALLAGGLVAAPLAAWLVRKLPPRVLGSAVGGLILVTNGRTIGQEAGLEPAGVAAASAALALLWATAVAVSVRAARREAAAAAPAPA